LDINSLRFCYCTIGACLRATSISSRGRVDSLVLFAPLRLFSAMPPIDRLACGDNGSVSDVHPSVHPSVSPFRLAVTTKAVAQCGTITDVKARRPRLVLGWVTTREDRALRT